MSVEMHCRLDAVESLHIAEGRLSIIWKTRGKGEEGGSAGFDTKAMYLLSG